MFEPSVQDPILGALFNFASEYDAGALQGRGIDQRDRFPTIESSGFQTFGDPRIASCELSGGCPLGPDRER